MFSTWIFFRYNNDDRIAQQPVKEFFVSSLLFLHEYPCKTWWLKPSFVWELLIPNLCSTDCPAVCRFETIVCQLILITLLSQSCDHKEDHLDFTIHCLNFELNTSIEYDSVNWRRNKVMMMMLHDIWWWYFATRSLFICLSIDCRRSFDQSIHSSRIHLLLSSLSFLTHCSCTHVIIILTFQVSLAGSPQRT